MGTKNSWSTHKQTKIEREGDPHPLRRGILKKGERHKGVKARMDEVIAAHRGWLWNKNWLQETKLRQPNEDSSWIKHLREWEASTRAKFEKVRAACIENGIDVGRFKDL